MEHKVVLVDFFATRSETCKTLAPIFVEQSNREGFEDVLFAKVDVDDASGLAAKLGVSSAPTFHLYKDGVAVDESVTPGPQALRDFISRAT